MKWYEMNGNYKDVVVSTRVRLARNLEDYPFEPRLDDASAREIIERLEKIYDKEHGYTAVNFQKLNETEALSWCERHLVSPEFARKKTPHTLFANEERQTYVMACEEDHVRIQSVQPGLALEKAYENALTADELLDAGAKIAYNEKLGYLTHCPTNLGTGMRASVMMFLPALTGRNQIRSLQNQLAKIGLTIRGMSGEGTAADGCLYQISNQVTLGISEEETLEKLKEVIASVSENERKLRESLKKNEPVQLKDRVRRAWGVLRYAELLTSAELLRLYADVRLGVVTGFVEADLTKLDTVLFEGMPATLTLSGGHKIKDSLSRDEARAAMVRERLA